jgi:hypothetical protein
VGQEREVGLAACRRQHVRQGCRTAVVHCEAYFLLRRLRGSRVIVPLVLWTRRWSGSILVLRSWTRPGWFGCWSIGRFPRAQRCSSMHRRCCRSSRCVRGFVILPLTIRTPRRCVKCLYRAAVRPFPSVVGHRAARCERIGLAGVPDYAHPVQDRPVGDAAWAKEAQLLNQLYRWLVEHGHLRHRPVHDP